VQYVPVEEEEPSPPSNGGQELCWQRQRPEGEVSGGVKIGNSSGGSADVDSIDVGDDGVGIGGRDDSDGDVGVNVEVVDLALGAASDASNSSSSSSIADPSDSSLDVR
jgi:hypothetical protein